MLADALRKDADDEAIRAAISACEDAAAELPLFDGLGLSFPDIVIGSRILGGETPKTKAMRENPDIDYETEFAKLGRVSETLAALCRASVRVRIINDGPMAAFSAAAELAADGAGADARRCRLRDGHRSRRWLDRRARRHTGDSSRAV